MIDWFPPSPRSVRDAAGELVRWRNQVALRRVADAVDSREPAASGHSERVADMAEALARAAGWTAAAAARLREVALLHDVGKVCVPDEVLLTPEPLDPAGYEVVKGHAAVGAQIVATVLSARQVAWARHHHERWDGRGYPDGLAGDDIPAGAAILGLADAWDAMSRRRVAARALGRDAALEECRRESGRQFAPWAVAALERVLSGEPRRAPTRRLVTDASGAPPVPSRTSPPAAARGPSPVSAPGRRLS